MKKYSVMVFEKGAWREMPYPAGALRDADIIAKNILATKKGVAKVAVISRNEAGKLLQTHREYSKNPAKKKVIKRVSTRAKKNPEIHIDINSHNAKKSAKAKTNPVKKAHKNYFITSEKGGMTMYYGGAGLVSDKKKAAIFHDEKQVILTAKALVNMFAIPVKVEFE